MTQLHIGLKRLIVCENHRAGSDQRHHRTREAAVFVRAHVAFGIPEHIEHAHQCRALAGEVVQVEQLEPAEGSGAQRGLDVVFVGERLELAGGHEEIIGLIEQAIAPCGLAENLEVPGFEMAGVFVDLAEIRISAPLADLMGDRRRIAEGRDAVAPVEIRARWLAVDDRIHSIPQSWMRGFRNFG
jgi:hypothetical protein